MFKEKQIKETTISNKKNNTDYGQINSDFILNSGTNNNSKYKLVLKTEFNELLDLLEYKSKLNKNIFKNKVFKFIYQNKNPDIYFKYLNLWVVAKSKISLYDFIEKTQKYLNLYNEKIADKHIKSLLI